MISTTLKRTLKYLLLLGIGGFLLWLSFRGHDLSDIAKKISNARPLYLILSAIAGFVAFLLRSYRWNMLIEPMGYHSGFLNASYALGIGYFANLAIPRIGEITRCGVLGKAENIPVEKLIGTVITERLIDLAMLFFSIILVGTLQYDLLTRFLKEKVFVRPPEETAGSANTVLYLIAGSIVCCVLILLVSKNNRIVALREKGVLLLRGVYKGLISILEIRNKLMFLVHTLLIWALYFISTYLCFFALESTQNLGVSEGLFILVAGGLGMSAPVQGGIGAYHYIVSQALVLFGISQVDGITYATLVHSLQLALIIVVGLFSLFMIARNKKK
ncbi:MAG: flippase-like domain-containing protein [Bacteroidia bacterium]|nr:flippase-like domain-containing protein [Bacteroidia bacterium]MCZ2278422.1 flippase-like domain-containing protein [Bacteroidia bacterium]